MDMQIVFGPGRVVEAHFGGFVIKTDQSVKDGGGGQAPTPSALFLASIGTCAGLYARAFCERRELDAGGLKIGLSFTTHPKTHMVERIDIAIGLPPGFPEKYQDPLVRAVSQCYVKKHLETPPVIEVRLEPAGAESDG